jgi:hypothetical protein
VSEIEFCTLYVVAERWILGCILHAKNHFSDTLSVCPAFSLNVYRTYDTLGRFVGQWVCSGPAAPACSGGSQIYGTSSGWKGSQLLNQADTVLNQQKNPGTDRTIPLLCSTDMGGHFGPKITCEISHGPYTTPVRGWSTHYR